MLDGLVGCLPSTTNGIYNTAIGGLAGLNNRIGYNLTLLGYLADICPTCTSSAIINSTAIGSNSILRASNTMILGGNTIATGYNDVNVGIGLSNDATFNGPRSKLEINADPASTTFTGLNGSGLQFRQLTSGTTLYSGNYVASYGKVLTVDADGIVKLTDDKGDFGYGICPTPTSLPDHIGMKLKDFNIYYEGQSYPTRDNEVRNSLGIGYVCNVDLPGKLSVDQSFITGSVDYATNAGYFHNGDKTSSSPSHSFSKRAIYSICDGYSTELEEQGITNVAGDFVATNAEFMNIAVRGRTGIHIPVDTYGKYAFAGYFEAKKSTIQDIGVFAYSDGKGTGANYGVYAEAPIGTCMTGSCSDAAGFFNGDLYYSGSLYTSSDFALKDNVQSIQNSMSIINLLNPKTYTFRNNQFPHLNLPLGTQEGLIAQEVQSVLPHLVKSFNLPSRLDSLGNLDTLGATTPFMSVNYVGIIPYLIGALKDQQQSIDSLRSQLEEVMNNCCGSNQRSSGRNTNEGEEDLDRFSISIELNNANSIILDQNSPNPFSEETVINYVIPKEVIKAIIMIYDNAGQVLKTVVINERGPGSLRIYAENLSSGIYSYTLIADGKKIDSKQMVCKK